MVEAPIAFLFADTQIVEESFLEDINNILNSGEVPNLFANDEWEKIFRSRCARSAKDARQAARDQGQPQAALHLARAREPAHRARDVARRLGLPRALPHVPVADQLLHDRLVRPVARGGAAESVAKQFLEALEFGDNARAKADPARASREMSSIIHTSVIDMADEFFAELKRKFYVTPKSFLELISLYLVHARRQARRDDDAIRRLEVGVNKLNETNAVVPRMRGRSSPSCSRCSRSSRRRRRRCSSR